MIVSFDVRVDTLDLNLLKYNVLQDPDVVERALEALQGREPITLTFSMNMDYKDKLSITHVNGYPVVQNDYVALMNARITHYE